MRCGIRSRGAWEAPRFLLFLILVATGILLTFYYVPDVDRAYESMKDLRFAVPFGVFLRNVHRWSAQAMVLVVILHMARVFYTGSYRPPREFNWVVGVGLLGLTLLLSFTGYLLPWDQLAYWAVTVGTNMASSTPLIGHTGPFHELTGARIDNDIRFACWAARSSARTRCCGSTFCTAWRFPWSSASCGHPFLENSQGRRDISPRKRRTRRGPGGSEHVRRQRRSQQPETSAGPRYRLLAYVKGETYSGKRDLAEDEVQVWPHLVLREFLAALTVIIFIWIISIVCQRAAGGKGQSGGDAQSGQGALVFRGAAGIAGLFRPLDRRGDDPGDRRSSAWRPSRTWTSIVQGIGEYAFAKRKFAVTVFTFGFLFWFALIFIGLFMRGPSWAWYWPWEDWTVPKETVAATWNLPALWGSLLLAGYFALGLVAAGGSLSHSSARRWAPRATWSPWSCCC